MCFTIGLFSVLDALLDATMETALESLPLSDEVKAALLTRTGSAGQVLAAVIDYQEHTRIGRLPAGITPENVADAYVGAVEWAEESYRSML